jgi:hypothetical protein
LYEGAAVFLPRKRQVVASFPKPKIHAGSVGHVSAATVERYIAEQKGK